MYTRERASVSGPTRDLCPPDTSTFRRGSSVMKSSKQHELESRPSLKVPVTGVGCKSMYWRRAFVLVLSGLITLFTFSIFTSTLPSGAALPSFSVLRPKPVRSTTTWLTYPDYGGQSHSSPKVERNENVTFDEYLSQHFDQKSVVPFVSLVDEKYAAEGLNFQLKLQEFGMDNPVVLICAEAACLDYAEKRGMYAYGGYYMQGKAQFSGEALQSRAGLLPWIKFTGLLELAREGWTNVWIEGDTYLNGNPFPRMLRWDEDWDIQFTADGLHRTNFGWMWTRAGTRSTTFWQRALDDHLSRPEVWDQQIPHDLLNNARHEHHADTAKFSHPGDLYVHEDYTVWTLNKNDFRPWHLGGLDPGRPDKAVFNHLTAVWPDLRPIVAKEFGWKANVDSYYSQPPERIITSSPLTGNLSEVTMQVRIHLTVAKATKRALWLPREVAPEGIPRRFIEVFPAQIAAAHVPVLESRYFEHAAQYVQPTRLQQQHSQGLLLPALRGDMLALISQVNASSAFSISLEDWSESNYREWKLDEQSIGQHYVHTFSNLHPCTNWEQPLSNHTYYWCWVDMGNGETGVKLDIDV